VQQGEGALAFAELAVFVLILVIGLAYVWTKGDLEWLKKVVHEDNPAPVPGEVGKLTPSPAGTSDKREAA